MSTGSTGFVERLRQPEYTGENRCTPCTIVNVVIAMGLGGVVSVFATPLVGAPVFAVCLLAIYLRGYLVPGTPALTKRYFPDWLLAMFDKHEHGAPEVGEDEREPEAVLADAGAVEPCGEVDDLCLDESFRADWYDRMESIKAEGTEKSDLSEVLDVDEAELSFEEHDDALVARLGSGRLGQWESRGALIADLAAAKLLEERYADWDALTVTNQSRVLSGLRIFLDACPDCGGDIAMDQETVESCCRTMDVVAVSCSDCDSRLLEVEHSA
ncbi:hypothetical protein NGM10_16350 (plasmid) [Halorussus salilacus]|uniref:hypothetical protein n=1 Tax=Halorussus salilacus TaxID=2953750 RepID=UPI0020A187FC|nr:hypothetical protein [Halorussus salilacus]USZ69974.1 hypothetical protein NGM10_16350 [Halorussus salilacus]